MQDLARIYGKFTRNWQALTPEIRGILFMCLAVLMMPVMNATAKALTADYPLAQVVWARFTGHFVCMTLVFWPRRGWRLFKTASPPIQLARSTIMFASNGAYIAALATKSEDALLVTTCDKLHNALCTLEDLREEGGEVWAKFRGARDGTLWYYRTLTEALDGTVPQRLSRRLRDTVDTLDREG